MADVNKSGWSSFFSNLGKTAVNSVASGLTGIGVQALGNSVFNRQQEQSSTRLMNKQAALQQRQALMEPFLQVQGQRMAGISPAFSGGSVSVGSPSVPMPSTGTNTGTGFDMFTSAQLKSLQLDNERKAIENARLREEDRVSRTAFENLARDLGLGDLFLEMDVPPGFEYDPVSTSYKNKAGEVIPLDEVKLRASSDRNTGSWNIMKDVGNTLLDIKRKGIENDLQSFQRYLNDLKKADPEVVAALTKMPAKEFQHLDQSITNLVKQLDLWKAQAGSADAQASYTRLLERLEKDTNVKAILDDLLPKGSDDNMFYKALRFIAFYFLSAKRGR